MILRHIAEHVKAQNWVAIGIDFVIVVLGVFVTTKSATGTTPTATVNAARATLKASTVNCWRTPPFALALLDERHSRFLGLGRSRSRDGIATREAYRR